MKLRAAVFLVLLMTGASAQVIAEESASRIPSRGQTGPATAQPSEPSVLGTVLVQATAENPRSSFLPEAAGTRIYSGKKTQRVSLEALPAIANNNYRQALAQTPGLLLSEESTPLLSVGYRGLDPHRAQFTQVLQDGVPIHADMFGYPEAYYAPVMQTLEAVEFLHGGAGLMYGPQPGGALNFVTRRPAADTALRLSSENLFGSDHLFSTYQSMSGTLGPVGYLGHFHERQGEGFRRQNSDYEVIAGGLKTVLDLDPESRLTINYDEYHEEHGEPGGITRRQFDEDASASTREFDRFRLERYYGSARYEKELSEEARLDAVVYGGHYRRYSKRQRGGGFGLVPSGAAASSNDIEEQDFYNFGFEPRVRRDYDALAETHTLTLGAHTFMSHSPRTDQRGASPAADSGLLRKLSARDSWYLSVFAENAFRWAKLTVTPGVRFENFWQRIEEKTNADKTAVGLADEKQFDFVPLMGLGVSYEVMRRIEVYSNISQGYRPKIFSQSVPTGTNQVVNSNLEPGKSWQMDAGVRGRPLPFLSWDASYFLLELNNQVGSVGNSVQNVGDLRNHGLELFTDADLVGWLDHVQGTRRGEKLGSLSPFVTATFIDGEYREGPNSGRQPQYAPKYNLRTGLNYDRHERIKVSFFGTFLGKHFADDASSPERFIPSYKVWDLTGEFQFLKNAFGKFDMSLFGGINNLFDEHYYARVRADGIDPANGRNVYGGLKILLG
ncbi:MAG: TonB-dependent receptor [Candidatus Omnitrophica bacterium]|nr:TonB-dependent receptor [Candidatus Omnitrophota bacterium]